MLNSKGVSLRLLAATVCLALTAACLTCMPLIRSRSATPAVEFWSTYATEKVLRDGKYTDRGPAAVTVDACKGEYESTQIIMTASSDVSAYTVEVRDLTLVGGTAIFPKANIAVNHEKYIEVTRNYDNNGAPTGWYPDCLVPVDKIVAAKENKIAAGTNQGLYVTFNVPVDCTPGVYTGSMTVTCDGAATELPVTLTVYDLTVSETTHSRSKFNTTFHHFLGELDSTQDMFRAYVDKMVEYRISPSSIMNPNHLGMTDADIRLYVDTAYELCRNPRMSNFNIPSYTASRNNEKTIDAEMLTKYVVALVRKSLENNFNLVERAIYSTGIIDEPDLFGLMNRVPLVTEDFRRALTAGANQVRAIAREYDVDAAFVTALEQSVKDVPLVVTMKYNESVADMIDTWCPYASEYDTEEKRAQYDGQKEKWWYTCVKPRPPYPSYHIEDTLISARALSWMMSEYNVVGNLYWAVDVYARYDGKQYQFIDDYYNTAARYPEANGDGFLFYPGAKYGVNGPLPSMRIEAIRDGAEEYELFYALKEIYAAEGYSKDRIHRNIASLIYNGTRVASDAERFATARKALIQLCMLAESDARVCVLDAVDDNKGNVTYTVFAKDGYELTAAGQPVTVYETVAGGKEYTVTKRLSDASNAVNFGVTVGGKSYAFDFNVGGKAELFTGEAIAGGFTPIKASVTATLEGDRVKLDVGGVTDDYQSVRYKAAALADIGAHTSKIALHLYNPSDEAIDFRLLAKYTGQTINVEIATATLQPGVNTLVVNGVSGFNWARNGKLDYLDLYFNGSIKSDAPAKTVYLDGIAVYNV